MASCPRNVIIAFLRQAPPQGLLHGIDATTSINMSPAAGTQLSRSASCCYYCYYYYYYYYNVPDVLGARQFNQEC